ncbi:hypothetical protein [Hymenobacter sp. BT559]|uniref:hypothetical protein n=1 Tax=Hymenobacter sp. BT559 TaxID=2795729 RepID=UPI0018EC027F|nr:hypothetical protein [Hymenobacter sp. BT559]MBJ6146306.1 hypothetical protein [Hymenobacter sp. BT559]
MTDAIRSLDAYAALRELLIGLGDPTNHYLLKAHCYEHDGRVWYLAIVQLNKGSVWDPMIEGDHFLVDVLLNRLQPDCRSRISIPCDQVWQIAQVLSPGQRSQLKYLYHNQIVFDNYPLASACLEA